MGGDPFNDYVLDSQQNHEFFVGSQEISDPAAGIHVTLGKSESAYRQV